MFDPVEIFAFFCVVMRIIQAQLNGLFDQFVTMFENVDQAFVRYSQNVSMRGLWRLFYR